MAYVDDLHAAVAILRAAHGGTDGARAVVAQVPEDRLRAVLVELGWLAAHLAPLRPAPLSLADLDHLEAEVAWLGSPDR